MDYLTKILIYCEKILDTKHFDRLNHKSVKVLNYEEIDSPIIRVNYPSEDFKSHPYPETVTDMGKMLYNELLSSLNSIEVSGGGFPTIRANYGVGTLPSLFGLNSRIVGNNLPWVDHLTSEEEIRRLLDAPPDLNKGFGKRILETYEFYKEALRPYPKCSEYIKLYHPDLQGPFDVAHLIAGSDIYVYMYDCPELVENLLDVVSDTYIAYMDKIKPYLNDEFEGNNYHWGQLYGGKVLLRDDSPVNLSLDMYKEFAQKYDNRILEHTGSGSIHFCGRADQWIFEMTNTKNLSGINFGHMPNVEFGMKYLDFIMPELSQKKIPVIAYFLSETDVEDFDFRKYPTGITYVVHFKSRCKAEQFLSCHCSY